LEPYPIKIETEHKVEVNTRSKKASHQPTAKHLANTKKLNYQQSLEVRALVAVISLPHVD